MQNEDGIRYMVDEISSADIANPMPTKSILMGDDAAALQKWNGNKEGLSLAEQLAGADSGIAVDIGPYGSTTVPGKPYAVYQLTSPHPEVTAAFWPPHPDSRF